MLAWPSVGDGAFHEVGGPLNFKRAKTAADVVIAGIGGVPYVAWAEPGSRTESLIRVARLNGSAWATVGGSLNGPADNAQLPSIADVGGVPEVAWQETNFQTELVQVALWDGSRWSQIAGPNSVGGPLAVNSADATVAPSIVGVQPSCSSQCSASGPAVAFLESTAPDAPASIYVKTWNGVGWAMLGTGPVNWASPTDLVDQIRTADIAGTLYLVWRDVTASTILVASYDPVTNSWLPVGAALNTPGLHVVNPSITGVGDKPYVAWDELDGGKGNRVHVARRAGGAWRPVGPPVKLGTGPAITPSIASVARVPYLAWAQSASATGPDQIRVARFDGSGWVPIGGPLNAALTHEAFGSQLTTVDRVPYVAWKESSGADPNNAPYELRVAQYVPPSCSPASVTMRHDTARRVSLSCSDRSGDKLRIVKGPKHGLLSAFDQSSGQATYAPAKGFSGFDSFTYTGNDGAMDAPGATVTFSVSGATLTRLQITRRFRAAVSGPSVVSRLPANHGPHRIGAAIAFTLDLAARVSFTLEVPRPGVLLKSLGCIDAGLVQPAQGSAQPQRCTWYAPVPGSFVVAGVAGSNRIVFSGRVAGHALAPGGYRLIARPRSGGPITARAAPPAQADFRIVSS